MIIVTARRIVARRITVKKKSYAYQAIAIATPMDRDACSGGTLVPEMSLIRENGTYEDLFSHLDTHPIYVGTCTSHGLHFALAIAAVS